MEFQKAKSATVFICILIFLSLFIVCYHATLAWMYIRCRGVDSYYSHAFLIPIVSAWLIWQKRDQLKVLHPEISWLGLIIIGFAALLHIFGTILYVFSVSGFSIFFLIIGTVLFLFGKEITKAIGFPLAFLIFMFPLPLAVLTAITFPLKVLVARTGVQIVEWFGIPVVREGFNIIIPGGNLVVGNPCSGLRSLIAFLALGAVLAYQVDTSLPRKVILFLLSIPIAILSNIIRVPILILVSHYYGLKAASPESVWHVATGMLAFIVGFMLFLTASKCLRWQR
ncbi:MAG TPA: exosortase [Deltaproteobacteria bacterium]|nr:exosortase [Deltaproteobacteria bacterium]